MAGKNKISSQKRSEPSKAKPGEDKVKKRGWDEIESLFSDGKKRKNDQKEEEAATQKKKQEQKKKNQAGRKRASLTPTASGEWVDDGLGGVYNSEGFTGRVEDGVKVFKAHVLRKPNAGETPDCPFDCKCCFI